MAKLFVFGIGGTGSRVLRSLTMMLAAGVDTNGYEIVPIIIDPDGSNYDLTLNITLMNQYNKIRGKLNFAQSKNKFFKTPIHEGENGYMLNVKNTNNKTFEQFIGLSTMSTPTRAMTEMLFSSKNLKAKMDVGFKGNPNIGSVVLNQIVTPEDATDENPVSEEFMSFANSFSDGDKIFIVSSIFGGTGASGFPLLLKSLRLNTNIPNQNLINNAEIGAITVLPYFKLEVNSDSEVNSDTFMSKARAALGYYEDNVKDEINALYFIADDKYNKYKHNEGGPAQKDKAHLVEFFAASAIVDFAHRTFKGQHQYLELGINDAHLKDNKPVESVRFTDFYSKLTRYLRRPLTMFALTANCFNNEKSKITSNSLDQNGRMFKNTESFYNSEFVSDFCDFLKQYLLWLKELAENNRQLDLFKLDCGSKPFNIVNGIEPSKVASFLSDYSLYFSYLNGTSITSGISDNDKFMEMHYLATEKITKDKIKLQ